jgi:hypothetical protein
MSGGGLFHGNERLGITQVEAYHSKCRTGVESANAGAARKALRLSPCSRPFRDLRPRTSRCGRRTVCVGESWRCFEVLFVFNNCIEFCFLTLMQPVQHQDSSYSEACQVLEGFGQRSAQCELSALTHVNGDHDIDRRGEWKRCDSREIVSIDLGFYNILYN